MRTRRIGGVFHIRYLHVVHVHEAILGEAVSNMVDHSETRARTCAAKKAMALVKG